MNADIAKDVAAVSRITSVPSILTLLCEMTGMGFAAVARVTENSWTACAVRDDIGFGLAPGGELDVHSTLCKEVRESRTPVVIDQASLDPVYSKHPTPQLYAIESYVSVPIVLGDGSYFGNLCAIDPRPAQVSDAKTVSIFVSFARLLALELENQRRSEASDQALDAERTVAELRERFIAVLGHDLRTPLSAVAACGHLLRLQAGDPERVRDLAVRIGASVGRMKGLIEDVLDFARGRLGGGMLGASLPVDDLSEAILGVVSELRDGHAGRTIEAAVDVGAFKGDRTRLQQLVSNLLGNALEHGDPQGVVRLSALDLDSELVISVHNEGEPIPAGQLGSVFDPFRRQDTAAPGEGLGLGLHICEQIVKMHGGTLKVESTRDLGTTFVATLPHPAWDAFSGFA